MSTNWSQDGQAMGSFTGQIANVGGYQQPVRKSSAPPPPICFNCNGEHFVIDCPSSKPPAGPLGPPVSPYAPVLNMSNPSMAISNGSNWGPPPPQVQHSTQAQGAQWMPPSRYTGPPKPPVVTRFTLPGQTPNMPGPAYGGPQEASATYQQHQAAAPPIQPYASQQSPSPYTPQYGPPVSPFPYAQQSPQPYSAPTTPHYGNPVFQSPMVNSQFAQPSGPQLYGVPGFQNPPQQFGSSVPPSQAPQRANSYPSRTGSWNGQLGPQQNPQWNNSSRASSFSNPSQQPQNQMQQFQPQFNQPQQNLLQQNTGYRRVSGTPRDRSQSRHTPKQEQGVFNSQAAPQTSVSTMTPTMKSVTTGMANDTRGGAPSELKNSIEVEVKVKLEGIYKTEPTLDAGRNAASSSPESNPSSRASTPFKHVVASPHSYSDNFQLESDPAAVALSCTQPYPEVMNSKDIEEDSEDLGWNWEYKKIFKEQPPTETVSLAQALSGTFDSTPAPLLHPSKNSVSRYARNDNLKDFIKPIRSQPGWSYLQEDPGFAQVNTQSDLIPLCEITAWTAARHGEELYDPLGSRKRPRSEETNEQDNVDNQLHLELGGGMVEEQPNKRHKNDTSLVEESVIIEMYETASGGHGTPTVARTGTPSFEADGDDVWAPQPGEGAALLKEMDPTEVLLRSLGVEGSPKPVRRASGASQCLSVPPAEEPTTSPQSSSAFSAAPPYSSPGGTNPQAQPLNDHVAMNSQTQPNGVQSNRTFSQNGQSLQANGVLHNGINSGLPQQNKPVFDNPHHGMYHTGAPTQQSPGFVNVSYNMPPQQMSYNNGMLPQTTPPQPNMAHTTPRQDPYSNATISQNNQNYPNQPYATYARQTSFSNEMPQQGFIQHSNGVSSQGYPAHSIPSQGSYMPPQAHGISQAQYAILQDPHQYGIGPQGQAPYGNAQFAPGPQGGPQFGGTPQAYYGTSGPPQGYIDHAQGMPQHGPQPPFSNPSQGMAHQGIVHQGNTQQGMPTHGVLHQGPSASFNNHLQGMQQQGPQPPFNRPAPGDQPRQDSGYGSSYSNQDTEMSGGFQSSQPPQARNGVNAETPSPYGQQATESDNEPPLTPISMELLGKTPQAAQSLNGRKPEPMRQPDDGGTAVRKKKRPAQPVVAAAYSRRW